MKNLRLAIHLLSHYSLASIYGERIRYAMFPSSMILVATLLVGFSYGQQAAKEPKESDAKSDSRLFDDAGYRQKIVPFLKEYCLRCHGGMDQQGEFRVDKNIPNRFLQRSVRSSWGEVLNVLNSHEMPPEDEKQPSVEDVSMVVDWITEQTVIAELEQRSSGVVLRRLNRVEYRNTIRDLVGVDWDVSSFPIDPATGGFDNNGKSLTLSPLHLEIFLDYAEKIVDRAIVEGEQPRMIRWRFEPESGSSDSNRVRTEDQNPIVNGGNNGVENGMRVVHHESWDKHVNVRDFRVPSEGDYIIRVRAAGRVPTRDQVVASAEKILQNRFEGQMKENPKGEKWHRQQMERDLEHIRTDRIYDYGSARMKVVVDLGGQPRTVSEIDVDAPVNEPQVYESRVRLTGEKVGINVDYAYSLPKVLENFWFQNHDSFARPELLVDWIEIEGPIYSAWPPPSHTKLIVQPLPGVGAKEAAAANISSVDELGAVKQNVSSLMKRAYRRPPTEAEVNAKVELYQQSREEGIEPLKSLKLCFVSVLVSPHFLFMVEPSEGVEKPRLDAHALATRLSYFLWSSMPDEELFQCADSGELLKDEVLIAQTDRMMKDPRFDGMIEGFVDQWLGLREVGANPPAADLYPHYDRHLEVSMVEESRQFFREVLQSRRNALELVRADYVVVNERMARFYGMDGVKGDHFRKVEVDGEKHRGGIVTQASILTLTSNGTRTSPVKRGTWILKNLLGTDPGLPVANAGDIAPKVPGIDKATVRQRLEIHRQSPQCARCHNKIDPLGFALENYNAAGQWRTQEGFGYKGRVQENDPLIDASSKMPDGTEISGVQGLQESLLQNEKLFLRCLSEKMFTYALGRELGIADRPTVDQSVAKMKNEGGAVVSLIESIVTSEAFRSK